MKKIKVGDILPGYHPYLDLIEDGKVVEKEYDTMVGDYPVHATVLELHSLRDGELLTNKDLQTLEFIMVYDAYKKDHGLLTTQEIIDIRKKRGWSQEKMAKFLDIGLKDIARYENGAIQTKAIDNMIRLVKDDKMFYEVAKYLNKLSFAE